MKAVLILGILVTLVSCDNNRKRASRITDLNPASIQCPGELSDTLLQMNQSHTDLNNSLDNLEKMALTIATGDDATKKAVEKSYEMEQYSLSQSYYRLAKVYCPNIELVNEEAGIEAGCMAGGELYNAKKVQELCDVNKEMDRSTELYNKVTFVLNQKDDYITQPYPNPNLPQPEENTNPDDGSGNDDANDTVEILPVDDQRICADSLMQKYTQATMLNDLLTKSMISLKQSQANSLNQSLEPSARAAAKAEFLKDWETAFGINESIDLNTAAGIYGKMIQVCTELAAVTSSEAVCWLTEQKQAQVEDASFFNKVCQIEESDILLLNRGYQQIKELNITSDETLDSEERKPEQKVETEAKPIVTQPEIEEKDETENKEERKPEQKVKTEAKPIVTHPTTPITAEDGSCSEKELQWISVMYNTAWKVFDNYGELKTQYDNARNQADASKKSEALKSFFDIYESRIAKIKPTADTICLESNKYKQCLGTFPLVRVLKGNARFQSMNSVPETSEVLKTCSSLKLHRTNIENMKKNLERIKRKSSTVVATKPETTERTDQRQERPSNQIKIQCTPEIEHSLDEVTTRRSELYAHLSQIDKKAKEARSGKSEAAVIALTESISEFNLAQEEFEKSCDQFSSITNGMSRCDRNLTSYIDVENISNEICGDFKPVNQVHQIKKEFKIK